MPECSAYEIGGTGAKLTVPTHEYSDGVAWSSVAIVGSAVETIYMISFAHAARFGWNSPTCPALPRRGPDRF